MQNTSDVPDLAHEAELVNQKWLLTKQLFESEVSRQMGIANSEKEKFLALPETQERVRKLMQDMFHSQLRESQKDQRVLHQLLSKTQ